MRILSFVLMALVGTMILGFPLQSYADPQLDTLLNIATQARDHLSLTISQINNVPDEINHLYQQGSNETDDLAKAVAQQDVHSAKQHFLAAMNFFKQTNDKINSLNTTTSNDQQRTEITQLKGEIIRLDRMANLLKAIVTKNNIDVNFTKFDDLIQTAQQDLDAGNIDDARIVVKGANDFLVETHNSLTTITQERISERAKDFTEKQIERFSKMNELNPSQNPTLTTPPPTVPANATGINATRSTIPPITPPPTIPPITPPPTIPPITPPPTVPANATGINATSSTIPPITPPPTVPETTAPVLNYSSIVTKQNPQEMLAELKKLVSEGKVNEALKIIKKLEAYQREKLRTAEKEERLSSGTNAPNIAGSPTNNTITTPPPITPPPTVPANATGINATRSTIPPITPPPTMNGDHEKHNPENKKPNAGQHEGDNHQDSNSRHD